MKRGVTIDLTSYGARTLAHHRIHAQPIANFNRMRRFFRPQQRISRAHESTTCDGLMVPAFHPRSRTPTQACIITFSVFPSIPVWYMEGDFNTGQVAYRPARSGLREEPPARAAGVRAPLTPPPWGGGAPALGSLGCRCEFQRKVRWMVGFLTPPAAKKAAGWTSHS